MSAMTPAKFVLALVAGVTMLAILLLYWVYRDDGVREPSTTAVSTATGDGRGGATGAATGPADDAPAIARMSAPTDCVRRPFRVRVTGEQIESVTFRVDGRQRDAVDANADRTEFALRIDPQDQSSDLHRVTASVRFTEDSDLSTDTLSAMYLRCPERQPVVRFTG